jgi:hypothetical protein
MPTQTLVATQPVQGPYPSLPVTAASLDLNFSAVDAVNGNYFVADQIAFNNGAQGTIGGDVLLVSNPTGGPLTISFTSQPLNGRSGDITAYSVGAGVTSAFKFSQLAGWADNSSFVYFLAQAGLLVAILKR